MKPPLEGALTNTDNDAQAYWAYICDKRARAPCQVRTRLKTLVARKYSLQRGRCRELADVLMRGRAFHQETRWKGNESRNIEQGYRLVYIEIGSSL